jgi:hypothetical protein
MNLSFENRIQSHIIGLFTLQVGTLEGTLFLHTGQLGKWCITRDEMLIVHLSFSKDFESTLLYVYQFEIKSLF